MVASVLEELRITGLGVIADATLPLADGFTVVTGETGAGKTMVVAGLGLLFGGRADPSRVRHGAERAIVEGRLRTAAGDPVRDRAEEAGGETDEDGGLVISRSVTSDNGRSRAYLGGRSVPVGALADVGQRTLTLHGQADQMRLLRPAEQRSALDRYGGETVARLLTEYQAAYTAWQDAVAELADRTAHARERAQEADMLRHGLEEISAAAPQPGEDDELRAESVRLEHAEDLRTAAQTAHAALAGDPGGGAIEEPDVSSLLGAARRALGQVASRDEALAGLAARCDELAALAAEVGTDLAAYASDIEADPARLAAVHERRAVLGALTRKYADTVDGVLAWAEKAAARLASLDTSEEALAALAERRDGLAVEVARLTGELHAARVKTAEQFGAAVTAELTGLAMPHAVVEAAVAWRPAATGQPVVPVDGQDVTVGPDGGDDVEIRLVAGPGAPALPLQRGASGGELSRVMLAVEVVFAGSGGPPTMVFDEVDAGVGGKAAVEVGRRLARLARNHQVLVVTHLPQVAAFADQHLVVVKDSDGTVTTSGVRRLDETERARELSRMLAGLEGSELGIAHAEELLATARGEKQ
jgi:DNA repair protein RecN (Recombination protein N)